MTIMYDTKETIPLLPFVSSSPRSTTPCSTASDKQDEQSNMSTPTNPPSRPSPLPTSEWTQFVRSSRDETPPRWATPATGVRSAAHQMILDENDQRNRAANAKHAWDFAVLVVKTIAVLIIYFHFISHVKGSVSLSTRIQFSRIMLMISFLQVKDTTANRQSAAVLNYDTIRESLYADLRKAVFEDVKEMVIAAKFIVRKE